MFDTLLSAFSAVGLFLHRLVPVAFAQEVDVGLQQVAAASALSSEDPRVIVVRIINVFLSVLGMVFLVLILYAGFTWMTAAGEPQKVEKAQKIIKNAIIGLIIILSSWAITRFILQSLSDATGVRPGSSSTSDGSRGGLGGGGAGLGGFRLEGIEPSGDVPIRNVQVRFLFTQDVAAQQVSEKVRVIKAENNQAVPGRFDVEGRLVTFTPSTPCPAPHEDRFCFEERTQYIAKVDSSMRSGTGQAIACGGLGVVCEERFRTGELIDVEAPSVVLTQPFDGQSIPQNRQVEMIAQAEDDAGVSLITFSVDTAVVARVTPSGRVSPRSMEARASWNTQGVSLGEHRLQATAYDIDSNRQKTGEVMVMVRAESCFDAEQNGDETGIDCGGSCGACLGSACTTNNQCAQGVCSEQGVCVEKPIITAISPNNGKIGTMVTISGANFGARPGQVWFGGDVLARLPQRCTELGTGWSDTAIVVEVPAGATTGPVRVKNVVSGLDDVSNDQSGPQAGVFTVNDRAYPGICALTPDAGSISSAVRIVGAGFGGSSDRVSMGEALITAFRGWTNEEIGLNVPALLPGVFSVRARVGEQESNPVPFSVISNRAVESPIIEGIDPAVGPVGQYITIRGRHFGTQTGTVRFIGSLGEGPADIEFPESCDLGSRYWSDTVIAVKIPATLRAQGLGGSIQLTPGAYQVVVQRREGNQSGPGNVTVTEGSPGPGLCGLLPDTGPTGTEVRFSGERFGSQPGTVRFTGQAGNADAISLLEWSDQTIRALVPSNARTGAVSIQVQQAPSNPLQFTVRNCNEDTSICSENERCCEGSGVCAPQTGVCPSIAREAHYAWSMSTGEIPVYPEVVEECNPAARRLSSPSPWAGRPGGDQACINADMIVRFTTDIDPLTVNGTTFVVRKCASAEDSCENGEIVPAAAGFPRVEAATQSTSLIRFRPGSNASRWQAASHYRIFLTTGIRSVRGLAVPERREACGEGMGYCFRFATRTSTQLCTVGAVLVNPGDYYFEDLDLRTDVHANPLAADDVCLQLNPDDYPWAWSVVDREGRTDGRVNVTNAPGLLGEAPDQVAMSRAETGRDDPSRVTATMTSGRANVSGFGEMSVALLPFLVEEHGPSCEAACINAYIWARLSSAIRPATVNPNTVEVRRCADAECRQMDQPIALAPGAIRVTAVPGSTEENALQQFISINPGDALRTGQFYRVLLRGGANPATPSILSSRGQGLSGLNSPDGFFWIFKTKTDNGGMCTVARVELAPERKIEQAVGGRQRFTAYPYSGPDSCSSIGQMIVSRETYAWDLADGEGRPDAQVARLVRRTDDDAVSVEDQDAPVRAAMSTSDQQLAEIIALRDPGQGETVLRTNIRATTQSRTGSGVYGLLCGQRFESLCPGGTGLTEGGCCAPRPTITARYPAIGAGLQAGEEGVCRNTEIFADFSVPLSEQNVPTAFFLAKRVTGVSCPQGTQALDRALTGRLERWYARWWKQVVAFVRPSLAVADVWCVGAIGGETDITHTENSSRVTFRLNNALEPNTEYKMYVRGETNMAAPERKGLMSDRGVLMAQEGAEWTFRTTSRICEANAIDITDTSEESPYLFTRFPEEHVWRGTVVSIRGDGTGIVTPITPVREYSWVWEPWLSSEPTIGAVAVVPDTAGARATVTSMNKNGTSLISGRIRIDRDELNVPSSTGRVIESAKAATFMMCEVPWPPRSVGPFRDAANSEALRRYAPSLAAGPFYNFSTMYCRDAGAPGDIGDLPEISLTPVPIGAPERDQGIVRQYLFTFQDPALRGDGVGIRIAENPAHLNAANWYAARGFRGAPQSVVVDGYDAIRDGDTYYISASNLNEAGPTVASVIYILSVNPNAKAQTREIVSQLMKNFSLNINMTQLTGNVCLRPSAQGGHSVYLENGAPKSCTANWECAQVDTGLLCGSNKAKLRRDRTRLSDVYTMSTRLETAKASAGTYPLLTSGSFIAGLSTSRWPSWSQQLSGQAGGALPNDPVNRFISCGRCRQGETGGLENVCMANTDCAEGRTCVALTGTEASLNGFDPSTCWKPETQQYLCPAITATVGGETRTVQTSHIYQYRSIDNGSRYELSVSFEGPSATSYRPSLTTRAQRCTNTGAICSSDTECRVPGRGNGLCRLQGGSVNYESLCRNTPYSASGACVSGGPLVGTCRLGDTQQVACEINGVAGTKTLVCSSDCREYVDGPQSICVPNVQCGNGRVDRGETCDDGDRNGRYGFCSRTCQQVQGMCGDGIIAAGELCDNGTVISGAPNANGSYCGAGCSVEASCGLNCRERAPHCGDNVINGSEMCDGGTERTSKAVCVSDRGEQNGQTCDSQTPCASGYRCGPTPTTAACGSETIKKCQGGTRQNQACEQDNECSDGGRCIAITYPMFHTRSCIAAGQAQQCTFANWSACQALSSCGDGVVDQGETCDEGAARNNTGTGRCTPRCQLNVCGDAYAQSGVEECDFGGRNGQRPPVVDYGSTAIMCTNQCRVVSVTGGYCGNNVLDQGESCDGTQIPPSATCRSLGFDYASTPPTGGRESLSCSSNCVITGCALCSSRLPPDRNIIEAVVRDGILQNRPVPGARVVLRYNGSPVTETYTDPDGRFRFGGIHTDQACGNYTITIALQGVKYNYAATDPAQRTLGRTSDPNDGYFMFQSRTFSYETFTEAVTRPGGGERVILLMPRPGTGETIAIREWTNAYEGRTVGQFIDPQLVLPIQAGYRSAEGGLIESCTVGSPEPGEYCERTINWNGRRGSLNTAIAPFAGLACYEADQDNSCGSAQAVAETIMYRRALPIQGKYRYFLLDFSTTDASTDGNLDSTFLKNLVRIAWRDREGMEHYQEVSPDTAAREGGSSCTKYWLVYEQDAVTGNVTIVNKLMCDAGTPGITPNMTQFTDDDDAVKNVNAVLTARE